MKSIFAKKVGMTQFYDENRGKMCAVTVLHVPEARVLQKKTVERDGYSAFVIGGFEKNRKSKQVARNYYSVGEFASPDEDCDSFSASDFENVLEVFVCGRTKGRGFSGVVKRWGFKTGRNTHGSHHHREPGSVGQCSKPGKIFKGKKLPGRYGNDKKTLRCKIANVDLENDLILVYGSVPGAQKALLSLTAV